MTKFVTYMSVTLHSNGAAPSEITRVMKGLGWKPLYGASDFAYTWNEDLKENGTFEKYCDIINIVHDRLKILKQLSPPEPPLWDN